MNHLDIDGYLKLTPTERRAIDKWVTAHDINISDCRGFTTDGTRVAFDCHERTEDGRLSISPHGINAVTITRQLREPCPIF